jgi:hypothetical protein
MKRDLLFVLLMPLFLALSTAAQQNNRGATTAGGATAADTRARFDSVRSRNFLPGSAEGLDEASLRAYTAIIDRHKTKPDARFSEYARFISEATQDSLRSLFTRMSRRQQLEQQLVFLKVEPPKPRQVLSEADFASFSDPPNTIFSLIPGWYRTARSQISRLPTLPGTGSIRTW